MWVSKGRKQLRKKNKLQRLWRIGGGNQDERWRALRGGILAKAERADQKGKQRLRKNRMGRKSVRGYKQRATKEKGRR